ncbi:hypothetical protein F4821DRAFT_209692 [Hypoxylon rubiginosum]|uniref:Uncharacterized protein n=1 Tax=Hypoxylon rubiginosum TaxID=110542 RepID=A0ACC0DDZ6_9PEZI|nr:hypothetical protein F4821DRAFT_209692 [Hypoxylon rubiginosum]
MFIPYPPFTYSLFSILLLYASLDEPTCICAFTAVIAIFRSLHVRKQGGDLPITKDKEVPYPCVIPDHQNFFSLQGVETHTLAPRQNSSSKLLKTCTRFLLVTFFHFRYSIGF